MPRELKPCGTRAAYERHRRNGTPICVACRAANANAAAGRRADAVNGVLPGEFAHGESGYVNYMCRCSVCRAAGSKRNRAYRELVAKSRSESVSAQ